MKCKSLTSLLLCVLFAAATPALAGTWATQAVLATNAYNGTVLIVTIK